MFSWKLNQTKIFFEIPSFLLIDMDIGKLKMADVFFLIIAFPLSYFKKKLYKGMFL